MKIAIHHRKGSFSDEWIEFCKKEHITYKIVSVYDNDIIKQLEEFDILLWHHSHSDYRDKILAKSLIKSLQSTGITIFPDINTCWHFDNKLAQKYLFESINAPLIPTYCFYDLEKAIEWSKETSYPKVFKLRGGAGSSNVRLIKSQKECSRIIKKSFSKGFSPSPYLHLAYDQFKLFLRGKVSFYDVAKFIGLFLLPGKFKSKMLPREKGYVYFQEFIPNNEFDTRVIVIGGDKAYGMHRKVRDGDFRASGSSTYNYADIRNDVLKIAFQVAQKLKLQSVAFDFIYMSDGTPLIVEMSYGFGTKGSSKCEGYWDSKYNFHFCKVKPGQWILEELLKPFYV